MASNEISSMSKSAKLWVTIALFLGLFQVLFLNAMGNIVGAYIAGDLQNMTLFSMMYSIYYLCNACSMPFSSKLGEKFGRKSVICFGILLYGAATTVAGFAPNMAFHVVMRGFQGLGQGFIMANILAYFGEFYDEAGRAKAMGMYSTLTGIVWVVAPMIGGVVGDLVGWRPVFYVALPLAIVVFLILLFFMPNVNVNAGKTVTIDWLGTVSLVIAVGCLVTGFSRLGSRSLSDPTTLLLFAVFIVALVVFLINIRKSKAPIITPALFANREYLLATLCVLLIGPSMFTVGSYLSVWIISICGGTATTAGTVAAVKSAVQLVLGYTLGAYIGKSGKNKLFMISASVIYIISNLMIGWSGPGASMAFIFISAMLSGYGTNVYTMCFTLHGQQAVTEQEAGEATSNLQFIQSLSGTIGLSIMGMIMSNTFAGKLAHAVPQGMDAYATAEELAPYLNANILSNSTLANDFVATLPSEGQALFAQMVENIRVAYSASMGVMFTVLSVMALVALFLILMMKPIAKRGQ